jgi:hypothetical protein
MLPVRWQFLIPSEPLPSCVRLHASRRLSYRPQLFALPFGLPHCSPVHKTLRGSRMREKSISAGGVSMTSDRISDFSTSHLWRGVNKGGQGPRGVPLPTPALGITYTATQILTLFKHTTSCSVKYSSSSCSPGRRRDVNVAGEGVLTCMCPRVSI